MKQITSLGFLDDIDIREYFQHEQHQFTPWLAGPENLTRLGEAVGLEFDCKDVHVEHAVGDFYADILCREKYAGYQVLIENQLEPSDHRHLGQLVTYLSGTEALIIIWICREFKAEHKSALEWLNRVNPTKHRFIGVEFKIRGFRSNRKEIKASHAAPEFRVVVSPNDWEDYLKRRNQPTKSTREAGPRRLEFWTKVREKLTNKDKDQVIPEPNSTGNMHFRVLGSRARISAYTYKAENQIGVFVTCDEPIGRALRKEKSKIEREISAKLEWNDDYIRWKTEADLDDVGDWDRQTSILAKMTSKFIDSFRHRILELV